MSVQWRRIRLRDVLRRSSEILTISSTGTYREVTVRLKGRGAVLRRRVQGSEIGSARRNVVRSGQFILSRIDARNGAFAIVPSELDGAVVSNDFPSYDIDTSEVTSEFVLWMSRTAAFVERCAAASEGSTNRVRLNEAKFLDSEIVVPELREQRRLVGRVTKLAEKLDVAMKLRSEVAQLSEMLMPSIVDQAFGSFSDSESSIRLGDVLSRARLQVTLSPSEVYAGVGTRMWGQGAYVHERRSGRDFNAERYIVRNGQLVYNEVWAHNGAIGVVRLPDKNLVVSRHFHVFDVDWSRLSPEYLQRFFQTRRFWNSCQSGSVSSTGRGHMRRDHLLGVVLPLPSLAVQEALVARLQQHEVATRAVAESQRQIDASLGSLLPSILDRAFSGAF